MYISGRKWRERRSYEDQFILSPDLSEEFIMSNTSFYYSYLGPVSKDSLLYFRGICDIDRQLNVRIAFSVQPEKLWQKIGTNGCACTYTKMATFQFCHLT